MKKTTILACCGLLALAACHNSAQGPTRDQLAATIDSAEAPLIEATQLSNVDKTQGNQIISLYLQFANSFPDDTMSAYYLHRAAQVATSLDQIDSMASYYDRVIENYPDYAKLDECYYEKGIALDNAGRKDEARKAYKDFLDEYPDHFLAKDISTAMRLLDMSDEMLIKMFSEKK